MVRLRVRVSIRVRFRASENRIFDVKQFLHSKKSTPKISVCVSQCLGVHLDQCHFLL